MQDLITTIATYVLAPLITGLVGWYSGKRKNTAEASASELDNVEKSLGIYRGIITDLRAQLQAAETAYEAAIAELKVKLKNAEAVITEQQKKIDELRKAQ